MPLDTAVYYDPYDYTIDADPYSVWKRLRDDDVDESRLERVHTATVRGYSSVPIQVR
jgi:hypothetical protein